MALNKPNMDFAFNQAGHSQGWACSDALLRSNLGFLYCDITGFRFHRICSQLTRVTFRACLCNWENLMHFPIFYLHATGILDSYTSGWKSKSYLLKEAYFFLTQNENVSERTYLLAKYQLIFMPKNLWFLFASLDLRELHEKGTPRKIRTVYLFIFFCRILS